MPVKITITFGPPADPEAFERHYVGIHAPLVEALPGLLAYEYGRALTNFDGSPPEAFWVVSLTFDDEKAMHTAFASPAGKKTTDDMANFITGPMKSVVSEV
ncbi:MAG TPA: EthD family reductase [Acidimicrobiia bacterium]|nr:EthD family reductase [Acidimicrobiia bacterium]